LFRGRESQSVAAPAKVKAMTDDKEPGPEIG